MENPMNLPALLHFKINPLRLEVLDKTSHGRQIFKTIDSFSYENSSKGITLKITVPVGFETDFASIPRIFWIFLPPTGEHGKAAVIHDFMYKTIDSPSRVICDAVFLEMMTYLKTPWYRKWPIYLAVRMFGWLFFNSNKEDLHIDDQET